MSALELFFSYILLIAGGNINETNNFNFHDSIIRIFHNMGSKNEASNKPTGKCERKPLALNSSVPAYIHLL